MPGWHRAGRGTRVEGRLAALIVALLFAMLLVAAWRAARAHELWPSVGELQQGLGLSPGQPLPKGVIVGGQPYWAYYEGAKGGGNGQYIVRLRLARAH